MSQVSISEGQVRTSHERAHPAVSIAGIVCTFMFLIVVVFAIFAPEQMIVVAYIAPALAAMGIGLALIASGRRTM